MREITLLVKPASAGCNLFCRYCFYRNVAEKRTESYRGIMSDTAVDTLKEKAEALRPEHINITFQGGEPTLAGLPFFVKFVEKFSKINASVSYAIQTNGTLINDEWASFFSANGFLVGLSLDGDKKINDLNRLDPDGKSTYGKVVKAADIMKKHGVAFNILAVVTDLSARYAQRIYNFFKKMGYGFLQFIPCIDDFGSVGESLGSERYESFLKALFDAWYFDFVNGRYVSIRNFDNYISILKGKPPESCAMGGVCGRYYTIESDGSVYPCDFYCTDEYRLGSIWDDDPFGENPIHSAFVLSSKSRPEKCKTCTYAYLCRGGCRRDREPDLMTNKYCNAYYNFLEYAVGKMRSIAHEN